MTDTHYECLGVGADSTPAQIRLAYLHKARENHPDTLADPNPVRIRERERAMVAINAAWFVLRDPDRRRLYDQDLERAAAERAPLFGEDPAEPPEHHDWTRESNLPFPVTGGRSPAAAIARLYTLVMVAVFILLAIAFAYAVIRSGSVGVG